MGNMTKYLNTIWIVSLLFTLTIAADFNLVCPQGWTKSYEKCYIVVPTLRSWVEADAYCQKYGARLGKPSGYTINDNIASLFGTLGITQYWIGYNIRGATTAERYVGYWSDGSPTTVEVGVWGDFEPNTPIGSCARVDRSNQNQWYMESCDRLLPSVCELTPCPDDTFRCAVTGRCLSNTNICDGEDDCGDLSDERNCATDCKYYIYGNSGEVAMPKSGSTYSASSTCVWIIEAPVGRRIQVQFTQFETEKNIDVLEFWEGSLKLSDSTCLARLSGSSIEGYQVLISSNNFLIVRFVSDASVQQRGFKFTWRTDFQCQITKLTNKRYTEGQLGDVRLLAANQGYSECEQDCTTKLTCTGFSYNKDQNNCYLLTEVAQPVDDNCCDLYVKTCPTTTGNPVKTDIPSLGGTVEGTSYNQYIYSPLYPIYYPGNLETVWIITSTGKNIITLEVKDIQLCGSDTVVIKNGDNPITPTLMTLTSSTVTGEIVMSTGNRMYIYMKLKEHLKCRGVLLAYKAACNFEIKRNTGTIFTPGYGVLNYPNVLECFWAITSVNGRPLRLTFNDFDVENNKDFVQAWIGVDDKGTPIYTGNGYTGSTPPPLISNTGRLAVKFITSAVGSYRGFRATFTTGCILLSSSSYTVTPARTSIIATDILTVSCNTGYTFESPYAGQAAVVLTCQSNGEYDKTVPVCSQAFCGLVPTVVNGYVVSSSGIYGGNQVVYACNPGYSVQSGTSLTISCQSNSQWEATPTCTANTCPVLPLSVTSGRREVVLGTGTSHNSILAYTCDENYELIGPTRIVCASGNWSYNTPLCQRILCPPQYITNGTVLYTGTLYKGDIVNVSCNTGFQVTGTNPYKCGIETAPTCENVNECTSGTATCNQNCVDYIGGYYCTCNKGYRISVTNPNICEDIDECAFNNGFCDHSCIDLDGSYNCTCNYGYVLYAYNGFQGLSLASGEDGSLPWNTYHIGHSCVLKQCTPPDQIINNGRSLSLQLVFVQGDSVQYLCDVGYVVRGSNSASTTISCQGDGTWNPPVPTCQIATCFLDVTADSKTTPTGTITYGSTYQLNCASNSTGVILTRYCAYKPDTGRYGTVGDNLYCPAISCGTPDAISGANTYSYSCTNYGCSFIFSCAGSYQLSGSSSNGDTIIRCGLDGRWDFGDIRCISALCTDPKTPPDATQVATSYEIGALVGYQCNRAGYAPEPIYPLKCINVGNTARWNVTYTGDKPNIPTCVDKTAPTFLNCFAQDFIVELYKAPNHAIPTAVDQSGFVKSVTTIPANYRPTQVVPNDMTVTYTATDSNSNTGTCTFRVRLKDQIPPTITCKYVSTSYLIDTETTTVTIDPLTFVQSVENGATITANSATFTLTSADVGKVKMITLTAIDAASNTASCTVQVYTTVSNKCQPWTIKGANTQKSCTPKAGNTGYDCTFTCISGYYFFNEVNSGSIVVSCFTNFDWNRSPPSCTARNPAYYRQSFVMRYGTGILSDPNTCTTSYQTQLQNQFTSLTSNLQTMCRTAQPAYTISIVQPVDISISRLGVEYNNGIVYATFTFDMTPADYVDTAYTTCATQISNAFTSKQTQLNPILSLSADGSCPAVGSASVSYDRILRNYFVCTTNAGVQTVTSESKSACFDCALGYYSSEKRQCVACGAGFYLSTGNRNSCDTCPVGTNSLKTGLTNEADCYLSCPKGMMSASGDAPCTQCGLDSYSSSNGLSCISCGGLKTTGVGKSTASDCKSACQAGYYSYNGLEVCTACPKNFYQAQTGQRNCNECGSSQITLAEGKTSPADCVDGFASVCNNRCLNGGTCTVVNHDYFCSCQPGYTGSTCESTIDPCAIRPCYNGGQCTVNGVNSFTCTCTSNRFSGSLCENDIDDCAFANNFNPCNNGSCHDLVGGYTCLCPSFSGFTGSTCTSPRNPCVDDPCINGQCTSYGSIRRKCVCTPGYTGETCNVNIDECTSSPCVNGGTCIDGVNKFTCQCPSGFSGVFCHVRGVSNICTGHCGSGQSCVDYYPENKPLCMCPNGYNDNNNVCQLSNFCNANSCLNGGTCISSYGGYICKCLPGYYGPSCQFTVDNCASQPCLNKGVCQNGVNTFTCSCTVTGTGGTTCLDNKDNCDPYPCVIANSIQCFDRINDYYCRCKPGFRGKNCTDGAEDCNSFPCQHGGSCAATSTGYKCTCATGWYGNQCESSVNNCAPSSQCNNGGTCYNTVSNFYCTCPPGYRGNKCDTPYDLCDLTRPCVGPNSTCVLSNGQPDCKCLAGYQGTSCNQKITACTSTSCLNGGTCVEAGGTVTCKCVPGYTGSQCGTNTNECAGNPCPTAATCIDGINMYTCKCNDGKMGSNCDKDLSYKFDIIVQPKLVCGDIAGITMDSVFGLSTTKLSVSAWVRMMAGNSKIIVSLYSLSSVTSTPENILTISSDGITGRINGSAYSVALTSSIQNGVWHHVVVTWNALNNENPANQIGRVLVYVDNVLIGRQENVATNFQLPTYGYLIVGGQYDISTKKVTTTNGFTGKISRLILAKEEFVYTSTISLLYNNIDYLPTSNIINAPVAYLIQKGPMLIDYQSEMSAGICRTLASCTSLNSASSLPSVTCPGDLSVVSPNRISSPTWNNLVYTNVVSSKIYYNTYSGTNRTWGMFPIASVGYDSQNNAAVCVTRFYNRRGDCSKTSASNPVGGSETCTSFTDGERCTIKCNQVDQQPSQPGPYYYTCSKYGMYDMDERLEPFQYPPCAAAVSRTLNVLLKITYVNFTLSSCQQYIAALQSQLRSTFTTVNNQWQQKLCNNVTCDNIPVAVNCKSAIEATVEVLFNTVIDPIINSQSVSRSPDEAVAIAVVDDKMIKYTGASPVQSSMEISLVPYCINGQQIVGNYCVACAPGSYYNSNTGKCIPCPIGQYQSSSGQTSCISCQSGTTTYNEGSQSSTLCYEVCSLGMYYSLATSKCEFCPVGFYQPNLGSFHCIGCGVGLTTANLGSTQASLCVDPTTITSTQAPTPGLGQSVFGGGGLSGGEIAAIVLGIFIFLLLLILLILCCCRERLPCYGKGVVEPEDKTPFKFVNRYGETDLHFTSYKLDDIREKRGIRPMERRKPRYDYSGEDTRSVHTDISVQVPVFLEKLDGSVSKKNLYANPPRSVISDQDMNGEIPRKKKRRTKKGGKRKHRTPQSTEYYENVDNHIYENPPTSTPMAMPPPSTSLPRSLKPLPKRLKTPSEASFATKTDHSSSGIYSGNDFTKPRKEHAIKIDSDNEDYR